jgi:hypothetical protein
VPGSFIVYKKEDGNEHSHNARDHQYEVLCLKGNEIFFDICFRKHKGYFIRLNMFVRARDSAALPYGDGVNVGLNLTEIKKGNR